MCKTMKRLRLGVAVFALAVFIAYELMGEVTVHYEMRATVTSSRVEFADDFWLSLLGVACSCPSQCSDWCYRRMVYMENDEEWEAYG